MIIKATKYPSLKVSLGNKQPKRFFLMAHKMQSHATSPIGIGVYNLMITMIGAV
ncbi:MAG: hypothetical protein SFT68_04320 [Rickettsiaceae bacterium]|nr:hypothetical protein [Rickettsiaceae bacterium]